MSESRRLVEILLVEDNPTDVYLTRSAFDEARIGNDLRVVSDGEEALQFLRKEGAFADAPTPDLILLDLNLPRKDGREVLQEIKSDEALRRIPVIVLTTSEHHEDIERAYTLHANSYVRKPVDFDQFARIIRAVESFWFEVVTLPKHAATASARRLERV